MSYIIENNRKNKLIILIIIGIILLTVIYFYSFDNTLKIFYDKKEKKEGFESSPTNILVNSEFNMQNVSDPKNIVNSSTTTTMVQNLSNVLDSFPIKKSDGLVGFYDASSFVNNLWYNLVDFKPTFIDGIITKSDNFLSGSTTSKVIFYPRLPDNYTLFTIAKYRDGATKKGRIFNGTEGFNWLSGFHGGKSGVSYHQNRGWVSVTSGERKDFGNVWVMSTDQDQVSGVNYKYRANMTDYTVKTPSTFKAPIILPGYITINAGAYSNENSDWSVAAVVIVNGILSDAQITSTEKWLYNKYYNLFFGNNTISDTTTYPVNVLNKPYPVGWVGSLTNVGQEDSSIKWIWYTSNAQASAPTTNSLKSVKFLYQYNNNTSQPINGILYVIVDNIADVFVNGIKYSEVVNGYQYTVSESNKYNSFPIILSPGLNKIEIVAGNAGTGPNPAGLIARTNGPDGKTIFGTNSSWKYAFVPSIGTIEISAFGDTGEEEFYIKIDGTRYPSATTTYKLSKNPSVITFNTPNIIDTNKITITYTNDGMSPTQNKDRNIRVQSIKVNRNNNDIKKYLTKSGLDQTRLNTVRTGILAWGGDYNFVDIVKVEQEEANILAKQKAYVEEESRLLLARQKAYAEEEANILARQKASTEEEVRQKARIEEARQKALEEERRIATNSGLLEISASGDIGEEEFIVMIDGVRYPSNIETYKLSNKPNVYKVSVPKLIDLNKVVIKLIDGGFNNSGKDKNMRVNYIYLNKVNKDIRNLLTKVGLDNPRIDNLRKGAFAWTGDYTFIDLVKIEEEAKQRTYAEEKSRLKRIRDDELARQRAYAEEEARILSRQRTYVEEEERLKAVVAKVREEELMKQRQIELIKQEQELKVIKDTQLELIGLIQNTLTQILEIATDKKDSDKYSKELDILNGVRDEIINMSVTPSGVQDRTEYLKNYNQEKIMELKSVKAQYETKNKLEQERLIKLLQIQQEEKLKELKAKIQEEEKIEETKRKELPPGVKSASTDLSKDEMRVMIESNYNQVSLLEANPFLSSMNVIKNIQPTGGRDIIIRDTTDINNLMTNGKFKLKVNIVGMPSYNINEDYQKIKNRNPNIFYLCVEKVLPNCNLVSTDGKCYGVYVNDKSKCNLQPTTTSLSANTFRFVLVSEEIVLDKNNDIGKNSDFTLVLVGDKYYLKNIQTGYMPSLFRNEQTYPIYGDVVNDKETNITNVLTNIYNRLCTLNANNDIVPEPLKAIGNEKTLRIGQPGCDFNPDKTIYLTTSTKFIDSSPILVNPLPDGKISIQILRYDSYGQPSETYIMKSCPYDTVTLKDIERVRSENYAINQFINLVCFGKSSENSERNLNLTVEISKFPEEYIRKTSLYYLN